MWREHREEIDWADGGGGRRCEPCEPIYRLASPNKTPAVRLYARAENSEGHTMRTRITPSGIGRWSAGRPWLAIGAWLAFVVLAVVALGVTGSKGLQSGVTGEAARAESMLQSDKARPAQYECAYLHSDSLRVGDPAFQAAVRSVTASMSNAVGTRVSTRVSSSGHSALVSGRISRPFSTDALRAQVSAAGDGRVSAVLDDNSGGSGNNDLSPGRTPVGAGHPARPALRVRRGRRRRSCRCCSRSPRSSPRSGCSGRSARCSRSTPA